MVLVPLRACCCSAAPLPGEGSTAPGRMGPGRVAGIIKGHPAALGVTTHPVWVPRHPYTHPVTQLQPHRAHIAF